MNIAIDIDDTLTNSFDYFQPCVAEFFNVDVEELKKKNISYGNLPKEWKDRELEFCKSYYDRLVPETPFKPDALWGINELRARGHKIIIITARANTFYTDPYMTTTLELENGGIVYDKLICTLNKAEACVEERVDVLIDDSIGNCESAVAKGALAFLFTSKANQDIETMLPRVANWEEIVEWIDEMV